MNSSPSDAEKPSASNWVLDASALLAVILQEPGADRVKDAISEGAAISAVNLSEVVARLTRDFSEDEVREDLSSFELTVFDFDEDAAWRTARLVSVTRSWGLSMGDRACLALAATLGLSALTAERIWVNLDVGVEVVLCR
jgi:PIN domain nuclease of toxin-antitoxin system